MSHPQPVGHPHQRHGRFCCATLLPMSRGGQRNNPRSLLLALLCSTPNSNSLLKKSEACRFRQKGRMAPRIATAIIYSRETDWWRLGKPTRDDRAYPQRSVRETFFCWGAEERNAPPRCRPPGRVLWAQHESTNNARRPFSRKPLLLVILSVSPTNCSGCSFTAGLAVFQRAANPIFLPNMFLP